MSQQGHELPTYDTGNLRDAGDAQRIITDCANHASNEGAMPVVVIRIAAFRPLDEVDAMHIVHDT